MNTHNGFLTICILCVLGTLFLSGCSTAPKSAQGKSDIEQEARSVLAKARQADASVSRVIDDAAGYAVFPSVGKGAVGIGGAYGKGVLFESGRAVGYCDLTQGSIGFQFGGQSYSEIIAMETMPLVDDFKDGNLRFDAQVSAVAIRSGVGANAAFVDGVAVFTLDEAGLMFEASVGGQQFSYQSK